MVINYVLTGLLAALLAVPGTGQREVTTVEDEPVVKKMVLTTATFALTDDSNRLNPNNYEYTTGTPSCSAGKLEVCYIVAEVSNPSEDEEDWLPVISEELEDEITEIFDDLPIDRQETANVKLRGM